MKDRYVPTKPLEFDRILVRGADVDKAVELVKTEMDRGLWVSVDDRLPKKCKAVLFYSVYDDGLMLTGHMKNNQEWYENSRGEQIVHVTHWMPLPGPPGGEG